MEKFNELLDTEAHIELLGSPNPSWDDTPEEPTALAYTPDPIEERVFITEAYAHDVVKLAALVSEFMEIGHIEITENGTPSQLLRGNPEVYFHVLTCLDDVKEIDRICNEILARGEE